WPLRCRREAPSEETAGPRDAGERQRRRRRALAPVVENEVLFLLVVVVLPTLHAKHQHVDVVAGGEEGLVCPPVPGVDRRDDALAADGDAEILAGGEELDEVLRAAPRRIDGEVLHIKRALGRFRHPGDVADGEAERRTVLLEQERVAEGE